MNILKFLGDNNSSVVKELPKSQQEVLSEFTDTLSYWMDDLGITDYKFKNSNLQLFTEISLVGKASTQQMNKLMSYVTEYGYRRISKLGILIKYYNDALNYGLLIEYPTEDSTDTNLFIHMYQGYDGIINKEEY